MKICIACLGLLLACGTTEGRVSSLKNNGAVCDKSQECKSDCCSRSGSRHVCTRRQNGNVCVVNNIGQAPGGGQDAEENTNYHEGKRGNAEDKGNRGIKYDHNTETVTLTKVNPRTFETRCGCSSCTASVLDRVADGHRVEERINWIINNEGHSEKAACHSVCGEEFSTVCGECNCDAEGVRDGEAKCNGCSWDDGKNCPDSWCNESQSNCNECTGAWFGDIVGGGDGAKCNGCSWDDGKNCPDSWCNESQSNCNECTGAWFGDNGGGGSGGGGNGFTCGSNQFTFHNKANMPVYIYNFPYRSQPPTFPLTDGAIGADQTLCVDFQADPLMRIYVADRRLSESIEKGVGPDGGNPHVDGDAHWSFVEYFWEPEASRYTFDLSYIDEFSYPVTVKFSNVGDYNGAVEGHEYGPKKMSSIRSALENQSDFNWKGLIWPMNDSTSLWHQWSGLYRVIGPNKVWQFSANGGTSITPFTPENFWDFLGSLPKDGNQLFGVSGTNWDVWQFNGGNQQPSNTGYTKALHSVSQPDIMGKYGFFCYPEDNKDGEFTWMPSSIQTTVTIYPFDN